MSLYIHGGSVWWCQIDHSLGFDVVVILTRIKWEKEPGTVGKQKNYTFFIFLSLLFHMVFSEANAANHRVRIKTKLLRNLFSFFIKYVVFLRSISFMTIYSTVLLT